VNTHLFCNSKRSPGTIPTTVVSLPNQVLSGLSLCSQTAERVENMFDSVSQIDRGVDKIDRRLQELGPLPDRARGGSMRQNQCQNLRNCTVSCKINDVSFK
jgi:hypothetical protein